VTDRLVAISRSLAALIVIAATMGGPPLALVRLVGWPLPRSVPNLDGLDHAAQTGISDQLIINILAVLAWITWAQIAVALAAEITAVARQRPARPLPLLPGVQSLAARLVAGAFLMASPLHATTAPALALPIVATASHTAAITPEPAAPPASVEPTYLPPDAPAAGELRSVTVERHDSYWAIAERHFNGDGLRWREIRDLNIGRTMPDGTTINADSDVLRPGWTLLLPATATEPSSPAPPPSAPTSPADAGEVVVAPGDHFWSLAEDQLTAVLGRAPADDEIVPYWRDLIDANTDRLIEPGNPNLLHPGQHLLTPPVGPLASTSTDHPTTEPDPEPVPPPDPADASAADDPSTTSSTTAAASAAPGPAAPTPTTGRADRQRAPEGLSTTVADPAVPTDAPAGGSLRAIAVAGSISAAAAVGALEALRRRRRQAAHRHPTRAPRPTSHETLHRTLLVEADEVAVAGLGCLLDRLAADIAASGGACRPRVVQSHTTHVDLLIDQPADPPPGWRSDGLLWTFDASDQTPVAGDTVVHAAPLLVTLGQPDDAGQLYLDLEAEGIVSLVGEPAAVRHLVTAIVTELALTPFADRVNVSVVGDLSVGGLAGLGHIATHRTWDDIADDIAGWAEQTHQAHTTNRWPNTFVARAMAADHDAVVPLVVIADRPPPDHVLTHVLHDRPASIALVVAAEVDQPSTVIVCQPDELTIPELGLTCTPHALEEDTVDAIVDLLDDAGEPADQPLMGPPDQPTQLALVDTETHGAAGPDATLDVLVRYLGEIRVDAPGEHLGAKQTAVIGYIALHRTVTAERLVDAIWAQQSPGARKRLANTISDCRAVIGHRYLPTAVDGRYSAGPGLHTDLDLFTQLVDRAAAAEPPSQAAAMLREALELVTGPVFTYRYSDRSSFSWVDLENLASLWELKVAAVAQRCAELYLDLDQAADAAAVAHRSLTIIPTHSGLTETLMRAHAEAGDDHAVRRVYQAHLAALAALDLDDPDESTTELYDELRQGTPASA
jgi:DNA-binding SARP family transcriptional activator